MSKEENIEEELLDDDNGEDLEDSGEDCSWCQGEGTVYSQGLDDEEDKDFVQCKACGGSGKYQEPEDEDDLDEN